MKQDMNSIDDRTHNAEEYVKHWEPQEGSPQPKQHDMIDALVEAFKDPDAQGGTVGRRRQARVPPEAEEHSP